MSIATLLATTLLAATPITTDTTPTPTPTPTVEYVPLNQAPDWYTTVPYMHTGACMITAHDITCATNTQWKHTTLNDRYTGALYKLIRKDPTTLTTITDVYNEIKTTLGEHANNFNIEAIANDAYIYNPTTRAYEPSPKTPFWAAVEANATKE